MHYKLHLIKEISQMISDYNQNEINHTLANYKSFSRSSVFFTMGVLPILLIVFVLNDSPTQYGLGLPAPGKTLAWILGLGIPLTLFNMFHHGKSKDTQAIYPLFPLREWKRQDVVINVVISVLYMFGYEFMFRGFLLFADCKILRK
jgi:membrane protease YdiL (CAAX protease family)